MDFFELLNLVGTWVVVTKKDGTLHKGFLDKVGTTQHDDGLLLASDNPNLGNEFKGRKIKWTDILSIEPGSPGDTNLS